MTSQTLLISHLYGGDSLNDLITSGEKQDRFIRVDVFEDHIVRTARVSRLFSYKMPERLNPYTETSTTLLFAKNSKGEPYLIGLRDSTEIPLNLLASLILNDKDKIASFIKEQLIALYNRVSPTSFEMIPTLQKLGRFDTFSVLNFPLLRHKTPEYLNIQTNPEESTLVIDGNLIWNTIFTTIRYEPKVIGALREANTMVEFCDLFFPKHALATPLDYELGSQVSQLWWIASWNMGITLTEQYEHGDALDNVIADYVGDVFPFLFEWLDEQRKQSLLEYIFKTVEMKKHQQHVPVLSGEERRIIAYFPTNIRQLMLDNQSKKALAQFIFAYIQSEKICNFDSHSLEPFWFAVAEWYSEHIKMPYLSSSKHSKEEVKELWDSLFGKMDEQTEHTLFSNPYNLDTMTVSIFDSVSPSILCKQFWNLSVKNTFIPHFDIPTIINPATGKLDREFASMMPYDDFFSLLTSVVENVDDALLKQCMSITPENRVIYLNIGEEYRDRKELWDVISWGVTDINHINALLATNEKNLAELKQYLGLPKDLFYELLFDMPEPKANGHIVKMICSKTTERIVK